MSDIMDFEALKREIDDGEEYGLKGVPGGTDPSPFWKFLGKRKSAIDFDKSFPNAPTPSPEVRPPGSIRKPYFIKTLEIGQYCGLNYAFEWFWTVDEALDRLTQLGYDKNEIQPRHLTDAPQKGIQNRPDSPIISD